MAGPVCRHVMRHVSPLCRYHRRPEHSFMPRRSGCAAGHPHPRHRFAPDPPGAVLCGECPIEKGGACTRHGGTPATPGSPAGEKAMAVAEPWRGGPLRALRKPAAAGFGTRPEAVGIRAQAPSMVFSLPDTAPAWQDDPGASRPDQLGSSIEAASPATVLLCMTRMYSPSGHSLPRCMTRRLSQRTTSPSVQVCE